MAGSSDIVPRGWHQRGYLPHFDGRLVTQSITYRLADSLPSKVIARYQDEVRDEPDDRRQRALRERIETFLDAGHGACLLRDERAAGIVEDAWRHFAGERYVLHSWVVMPNHVHVLCSPLPGQSMPDIIRGWKAFTARRINALSGRTGQLWLEDYWDRYIRDGDHFRRVVDYIHANPVKAGLVKEATAWRWSSAARNGDG